MSNDNEHVGEANKHFFTLLYYLRRCSCIGHPTKYDIGSTVSSRTQTLSICFNVSIYRMDSKWESSKNENELPIKMLYFHQIENYYFHSLLPLQCFNLSLLFRMYK